MKLACSVLAFHDRKPAFGDTILSIEDTRFELDNRKVHTMKHDDSRFDTMLSIVDSTRVQGSITDLSIIKHIVESIDRGDTYRNFIYGAPSTRRNDMTKQQFIKAIQKIDSRISRKINLYIEPLPFESSPYFLQTFTSVVELCKEIECDNITCLPLFDLYAYEASNEVLTPEYVSSNTNRIHVSAKDNTLSWQDRKYTKEQLVFIRKCAKLNKDIAVSYEYINNTDDNTSLEYFISAFSTYDYLVVGAGIYGRYISRKLSQHFDVVTIAKDDSLNFNQSPQGTASLVNQARVHNGYHYPRSITTALHSVNYYERFKREFKAALIENFDQVYAIPKFGSMTSAKQFDKFANDLHVKCDTHIPDCLNQQVIEGSWLTDEVAIDTKKMMQMLPLGNTFINDSIISIDYVDDAYIVTTSKGHKVSAKHIVNCAYAGISIIESMSSRAPQTNVVYEACEIALFQVPEEFKHIGVTFMDGPFVSCMPFDSKHHSLTSVLHTPHYEKYTTIDSVKDLKSQKDVMLQQLKLYVDEEIINKFKYIKSHYVVKTIPRNATVDDNRLIQINTGEFDDFTTILGGKLNAIYDCDSWIEEQLSKGDNK